MKPSEHWIEKLGLSPHPEGGYYREIYSSNDYIEGSRLSGKYYGRRNLSTSIYFLLRSGEISNFHRLKSDEIWYFHTGSPVRIYTLDVNGNLAVVTLGCDIDNGEVPQAIIPAGTIFGAEIKDENTYSLVGCMVSPGFHFDDFELMTREFLLERFPEHKDIIIKLTSDN
jgi:hypothetical protein